MYHKPTQKTPVIFLMGPTASGKTALALTLATTFPMEIINADSVQIYRGLEIGSAKPTTQQRQQVVHHLLDVTDPDAPWSADKYRQAAWETIHACHQRGNLSFIVGGSGLYLRAVEKGLVLTPPVDDAIIAEVRHQGDSWGWSHLHAYLSQIDPESAQRITPKDSQRILRAVSLYQATGIALSEWYRQQPPPPPVDILKLSLEPPREILYQRINARFDQMMAAGFLQEAELLLKQGYDRQLPAMKAVGYRQIFLYLDGLCSLDEAIDKGRRESRRYAKRQETWLKQETNLIRLTEDEPAKQAVRAIKQFLTNNSLQNS